MPELLFERTLAALISHTAVPAFSGTRNKSNQFSKYSPILNDPVRAKFLLRRLLDPAGEIWRDERK